ncbi:hypothetical protein GCM10010317_062720 [Streptomyces mirabilis]|nr:hypothetical protein GCM10010317_062720 [Streptomyces mirabilis]
MYPIVVSTVEWPQTSAAMCGGDPERMASVMEILRKPWGRHRVPLPPARFGSRTTVAAAGHVPGSPAQ